VLIYRRRCKRRTVAGLEVIERDLDIAKPGALDSPDVIPVHPAAEGCGATAKTPEIESFEYEYLCVIPVTLKIMLFSEKYLALSVATDRIIIVILVR
jgi:hypothetical protein